MHEKRFISQILQRFQFRVGNLPRFPIADYFRYGIISFTKSTRIYDNRFADAVDSARFVDVPRNNQKRFDLFNPFPKDARTHMDAVSYNIAFSVFWRIVHDGNKVAPVFVLFFQSKMQIVSKV